MKAFAQLIPDIVYIWAILALLGFMASSSGCQKMNTKGRLRPYQFNAFLPNGSVAQMPPAGTVPRSRGRADEAFLRGTRKGVLIKDIPVPITDALVARGRERYEIFCSPCHNQLGDGLGMVVRRGFTEPPSYHTERLRNAPSGYFFDVITRGRGAMFSYADRVPPEDRWAIIAYIRALQLSQHARYADLPADLRARLKLEGSGK